MHSSVLPTSPSTTVKQTTHGENSNTECEDLVHDIHILTYKYLGVSLFTILDRLIHDIVALAHHRLVGLV